MVRENQALGGRTGAIRFSLQAPSKRSLMGGRNGIRSRRQWATRRWQAPFERRRHSASSARATRSSGQAGHCENDAAAREELSEIYGSWTYRVAKMRCAMFVAPSRPWSARTVRPHDLNAEVSFSLRRTWIECEHRSSAEIVRVRSSLVGRQPLCACPWYCKFLETGPS